VIVEHRRVLVDATKSAAVRAGVPATKCSSSRRDCFSLSFERFRRMSRP
jgi:hypothetical protein